MKVAIIGSRNVKAPKVVFNQMAAELPDNCTEIISCGAEGVDKLAEKFAKENGIKFNEISANTPQEQSQKLSEYADYLLAFWDTASKGTAIAISTFTKVSKHVKIICINK